MFDAEKWHDSEDILYKGEHMRTFGLIFAAVCIIIIMPIIIIWALNLLFGLVIPYTLNTWFATLILGGIVSSK